MISASWDAESRFPRRLVRARCDSTSGRTMKRYGHEKQFKTFHGPVATRRRGSEPRSGRRAWDGENSPGRKAVRGLMRGLDSWPLRCAACMRSLKNITDPTCP